MVWNRKEYDRKHSKEIYAQYKSERITVLKLFSSKCYCCGSIEQDKLCLHHKYYDDESNYPRTSNGWSRIRRIREAKANPDKFTLLCGACHRLIHSLLSMKNLNSKHFEVCGLKTLTVSYEDVGVETSTAIS